MKYVRRYNRIRQIVISILVTIVFSMIVFGLSLAPIMHGIVGVVYIDKVYHFVSFFCLAFPITLMRPRLIVWVLLGAITFGGFIELAQDSFGRQASWSDFISNGIGAIVGGGVARFLGIRLIASSKLTIKNTKS